MIPASIGMFRVLSLEERADLLDSFDATLKEEGLSVD